MLHVQLVGLTGGDIKIGKNDNLSFRDPCFLKILTLIQLTKLTIGLIGTIFSTLAVLNVF
jgi:hypothetical protein